MRVVTGNTDAHQAFKWIYRDLQSLDDWRISTRLTLMAAALKFGKTPRELLEGEMRDIFPDEQWAKEKPGLESIVLGTTGEQGPSTNGHH